MRHKRSKGVTPTSGGGLSSLANVIMQRGWGQIPEDQAEPFYYLDAVFSGQT